MVRIQIRLTEEQHKQLKKKAGIIGVSMAELVRRGVDIILSSPEETGDEEKRKMALELIGKFRSGNKDIAANHDKYLRKDFKP